MNKRSFSALLASLLLAGSAFAGENSPAIGIVNFTSCVSDSKTGKKEQDNMENIRKQVSSMIEETEKELKELAAKFEDTEFVDSLSPKAEEEMKVRYQALQDDLNRYHNQFYQVLQHAQYQLVQKVSSSIAKAAESVAKAKKLDYVLNKEVCFYIRSDLDVTNAIITEMDKAYDAAPKAKSLSENAEGAFDLDEFDDETAG